MFIDWQVWRARIAVVVCMTMTTLAAVAQPGDYPAHPIKLVVAFAAGGASDALARMVAQQTAKSLGQPIVIDNIAGGGGALAARNVARASPDGYTLMLGSPGSLIINPLLQPRLPYDPKAFTPVVLLARIGYALMVRKGLGANTVEDLVRLSQSNPNGLTVGSAGIGSNTHLVAMSFMTATGAKLRHIPYKGTAPAMNDLMAGNIDVLFDSVPVVIPYIHGEKVRILAVTGTQREAVMPKVPTISESGWTGFAANNWFGIFAPPKTPETIVQKLNQAFNTALQDPGLRQRLQASANRAAGGTSTELSQWLQSERASYQALIERAHISME